MTSLSIPDQLSGKGNNKSIETSIFTDDKSKNLTQTDTSDSGTRENGGIRVKNTTIYTKSDAKHENVMKIGEENKRLLLSDDKKTPETKVENLPEPALNNSDSLSRDNKKADDSDDDSDIELLSAPAFLADDRVKPEIKTPEKCSSLSNSPCVSPYVEQPLTVKCRYSLKKLVLEKPKHEKKDKELIRVQNEIHDQIEKGRLARFNKECDNSQTEEEDKEVEAAHQKELEKYEIKEKQFDYDMPEINIFPNFEEPIKLSNGCCLPFPKPDDVTTMDSFTKSLFDRSSVEVEELLCGHWIKQRYLVKPYTSHVIQWLYHVLCYHMEYRTTQASYDAIWSLLNAINHDGKNDESFPWYPNIDDFLAVFLHYGATRSSLFLQPDRQVNVEETGEGKTENNINKDTSYLSFPSVNFCRVIQFFTLSLRNSSAFPVDDIEMAVKALCSLSLDSRMDVALIDVKTCLDSCYNSFRQTQWPQLALRLSVDICKIGTHHRHKFHLIQIQPFSLRGKQIKRFVSLQTLIDFIANQLNVNISDVILTDVTVGDPEITDVAKCFEIVEKLLFAIEVNEDTDYYKLYTVIEIVDAVVGAELMKPNEKVILDRISQRLRKLHSSIKDPRALFLSRTKVKDLILRTISKFSFLAQGKKLTQPGISAFFEKTNSDMFIETLEETSGVSGAENCNDEDEDMSPDSEYSDEESGKE